MPVTEIGTVHLEHSTLGELLDALTAVAVMRGRELLVMTEVGVDDGVLMGRRALSVRSGYGTVTISADERMEEL